MTMPRELASVLTSPKGSAHYVRKKMASKKLSTVAAANLIGVNQSTLSRYLNGASLTEEMAAKINKGLEIDIDTLFNLEAQKMASRAKQLAIA